MTPKEELQSLLQSVQSPEIKQVLSAYQEKLESEAKAAIAPLEAHVNTLSEEAKALWAKIKAAL